MNKGEAKNRIEQLKQAIGKYRYAYHVLDQSLISEEALDSLKHELFKLEQENPEFITADSPTQRVGGVALKAFKKYSHKTPMLSMEDVFSFEELEAWLARVKRVEPTGGYDFFAEVKMDGLALELVYVGGLLKIGATRGDGKVGEDVTENVKTIEAIPLTLRMPAEAEIEEYIKKNKGRLDELKFRLAMGSFAGEVVVRGEAFLLVEDLKKLNEEQKKKGLAPFANPRNAAAGAIRQLDSKVTAMRRLSFYGYDLATDFGLTTHEQKHEVLRMLGIPTIKHTKHCQNLEEVGEYHKHIQKIRASLPFWTDGEVVNVNDLDLFARLGVVGKTPRGIVAYKFPPEEVTTVVEEIFVNVGRTGKLTPVAVMQPVAVAGTVVRRASMHNMDEVKRMDIRVGDTVVLHKAGDIIPEVTKYIPELRPAWAKPFEMPEKCPVCGGSVVVKGAYHVCANPDCAAKTGRSLEHFASKGAFNIEHLGPAIIDALFELGLIKDPADLFGLTEADLLELPLFKEKAAKRLLEAISMARKVTLPRLIYGLGIPNVGIQTAVDLSKEFGTIDKISAASLEELKKVEGVGGVVAQSIVDWFGRAENKDYLERLLGEIVVTKQAVGDRFAGEVFVFTGGLEQMTRDEAWEKVRALGGEVSESIGRKVTKLVAGPGAGSKLEKARELKISILSEQEFIALLG